MSLIRRARGRRAVLRPSRKVQQAAEVMLRAARANICGDSQVVESWQLESHTLGCRNAADEPEECWIDRHWAIYDEYAEDGISTILGDPGDGVFVTMTPQRGRRNARPDPVEVGRITKHWAATDAAQELLEVGGRTWTGWTSRPIAPFHGRLHAPLTSWQSGGCEILAVALWRVLRPYGGVLVGAVITEHEREAREAAIQHYLVEYNGYLIDSLGAVAVGPQAKRRYAEEFHAQAVDIFFVTITARRRAEARYHGGIVCNEKSVRIAAAALRRELKLP